MKEAARVTGSNKVHREGDEMNSFLKEVFQNPIGSAQTKLPKTQNIFYFKSSKLQITL